MRYGAVGDGAPVVSLLEKPSLCKMSRAMEDWELWGAATMVVKQHGDQAPTFVAERIGALALAGDQQGIETWKRIAARIEQLRAEGPAKH